ncbi:hypothetical protein RN001_005925 [Aquatica leii]|uniref:MADF domain-containing protein n=1 Tax=Aquatica leii TaxID=1421715 RepID=A0AAN7PKI6_9COLE|nr:hypothetical protein RN001_005925 [Aquatica leii]
MFQAVKLLKPSLSQTEMKTKFANLKTTFMQEFRKYKESLKSGTEDYFEKIRYVAEHNEIRQAYDSIGTNNEDVADDDEAGLEDDSCKGSTTSNDIEDTMDCEGKVQELATLGNSVTPRNRVIKRKANSGDLNMYLKSVNSATSDMRAAVIQNQLSRNQKMKHLGFLKLRTAEIESEYILQMWNKKKRKAPTIASDCDNKEHAPLSKSSVSDGEKTSSSKTLKILIVIQAGVFSIVLATRKFGKTLTISKIVQFELVQKDILCGLEIVVIEVSVCSQNGTEMTTDGEIAETIKNWLTLAKLGLRREETKDAQENTDKLIKW